VSRLNKFGLGVGGIIGLVLFAVIGGIAQAAQPGFIAQGFQSSGSNLPTGALVSLKDGSANTVELSNTGRADRLVGVVSEQAFLEVGDDETTVQVVLDGGTPALVSNLNGDVRAGDRITASPIAGVGMRATRSSVVVGIAQADLSSVTTAERGVTGQNGQTRNVSIGLIPVQINVAAYIAPDSRQSSAPGVLQNLADAIAGRPVSALRVVLATVITILLFGVIVVALYSAVRSSIISIGRNPLSEHSLRKSMVQVGLMVLGVAAIGLATVYAILRL
jgi:hypothetical protein